MIYYRLFLILVIAGLLAIQRSIMLHLIDDAKLFAGYIVSASFLVAVAEFATLFIRNRIVRTPKPDADLVPVPVILAIASLLLLTNGFSNKFSQFLAISPTPPPTIPLIALIATWISLNICVYARLVKLTTKHLIAFLCFIHIGLRLLNLQIYPFDLLAGDMLSTIDKSLDELLSGRFPYVDHPPVMPYLPGLFVAYLPPKLLGIDIRFTNLACELMTLVILGYSIDQNRQAMAREGEDAFKSNRCRSGLMALPLFMLHPVWIPYSVNTQYAPCLLAATVLGIAVSKGGPVLQAMVLGFAIGSNQMFLIFAPILFGHWLVRFGLRSGLKLSLIGISVFLGLIAPFLIWRPRQFIEIALLSRGVFPTELLAGRLTLFPMLPAAVPHLYVLLSVMVVVVCAISAMRASRPGSDVAIMAIGLCSTLLLQPVSFTHYFLPVITLAMIAVGWPGSSMIQPKPGKLPHCHIPMSASRKSFHLME